MTLNDYYGDLNLYTETSAPNGRGGFTKTWTPLNRSIQGLINQASTAESEMAAKLGITAAFNLYCDVGVVIDHENLIEKDGSYYRIVGKPKNTVGRNHHWKIPLEYVSLDEE